MAFQEVEILKQKDSHSQLEGLIASDDFVANAAELVPRLQQRLTARLAAASAVQADAHPPPRAAEPLYR